MVGRVLVLGSSLCLSVSVTVASWAGGGPQAEASVTVLSGGHLLDGTGAPIRRAVDIFVAADRIAAIVASGSRPVPKAATLIDARGKWIVPGLIDSHVHYQPWMAELFLYHGVTSVVDLGNETSILEHRDAIRSKTIPGPRLFVTGQGLQGPPPPYDATGADASPLRFTVRSAEEAARKAAQLLDQGADAIKVRDWMPPDWVRAVTAVARARGKPVVGHVNAFHEGVEAGLNAVAHARGIDQSTLADEAALALIRKHLSLPDPRARDYPFHLLEPARYAPLIATMVEKGVFFNPTFGSTFRGIYPERDEFDAYDSAFMDAHVQDLGYLTAPLKARLLPHFGPRRAQGADGGLPLTLDEGMEKVAEFMRQFARAGGRMIAGTDTSGSSGGLAGVRLHRELQLWVARGIPPIEAIRAATHHPSELFRLQDVGTVQVGKKADMVVLNGNPLDDIRFLGTIDTIVLDGDVVHRELNPASLIRSLRPRR